MSDIALRFHKDMLVLSSPLDASLERQGVDVEQDREFIGLIEPEAVQSIYRLEMVAGAQCLVTNTSGITQARLAHLNMADRAPELAQAFLTIIKDLKPQHIFAEIGPTNLPIDPSSASSLKQNRDQYAAAVHAFGEIGFDAFFLNGMARPIDMQCALMGVRKESDLPLVAVVNVSQGNARHFRSRAAVDLQSNNEALVENSSGAVEAASFVEDALDTDGLIETLLMMEEYGADVVGFSSDAPLDQVVEVALKCCERLTKPLLVSLIVKNVDPKQGVSTKENPYYCADTMIEAASRLHRAGVQFLRAEGAATPAYTAALVVATDGFDVVVSG